MDTHRHIDEEVIPTFSAPAGYAYHSDDDTPCHSPGPCSFVRLVYWRVEKF